MSFGAYWCGNEPRDIMGRPPLFKVAMTNTERSRRRRAGLAVTRAAPKTGPNRGDEEIVRLKAHIAELEARTSGVGQRKPAAASYDQPSGRGAREAYLRERVRELEAIVEEQRVRIAELEAQRGGNTRGRRRKGEGAAR
jgi:hypothetical protein